ncbi:centrobin isoform X2 [Amia ocellicauda]|uniref:centrobin isoform X2 n=1 Tax=Amia ocellicauda TaxID=2972642 RepID=UPI00346405E9
MDCELRSEDLLSDVEPLSVSPPALARSWPPSPLPLSALSASRQVTARLYASLQSSRAMEVRGQGQEPCLSASDTSAHTHRQVTFSLSAPNLQDAPLSSAHRAAWRDSTPLPSAKRRADLSEPGGLGGGDRQGPTPSLLPLSPNSSPSSPALSPQHRRSGDGDGLGEELDRSLQAALDHSSLTAGQHGMRHILDMEGVRAHLQGLLSSSGGGGPAPRASPPQDADSFDSDSTATLLSARPSVCVEPEASPPLSVGGLEELFPRYSQLRLSGAPPPPETHILRDSLERERTRRKHCEAQLQSLHSKTLQLQQQLAMAVSADRKKDIMIEQLDKTLAKVVEGWKKHEVEKSVAARRLQEDKECVERESAALLEERGRLERESTALHERLAQTDAALRREQRRLEELQSAHTRLEGEAGGLRRALAEQTDRAQCAQAAQVELQEAAVLWENRERELQERLDQQGAQLNTQIHNEKAGREQEAQRARELQQVLDSVQSEVQRLERELEETQRARDSAGMETALAQARFEAQRSQLEVEMRLSVEQQVTDRLRQIHEDNAQSTAALRDTHRKQLLEISAQHERELTAQLTQFRTELQEKEERLRTVSQEYESRVRALQEEGRRLQAGQRRQEAQRGELVAQLQGLLRSHWAEALRLLGSQSGPYGQADGFSHLPGNSSSQPGLWGASEGPGRGLAELVGAGGGKGTSPGPQDPETPGWGRETGAETKTETVSPSLLSRAVPLLPAVQRSFLPLREGGGGGVGGELSLLSLSPADLSFRPLEPQLDSTALGGCDLEELAGRRLAEESWNSTERGREQGPGTDRDAEGRSLVQELSGYRLRLSDAQRESGRSTDRERGRESGHSTDRERERGKESGHSTDRERERARDKESSADRDRERPKESTDRERERVRENRTAGHPGHSTEAVPWRTGSPLGTGGGSGYSMERTDPRPDLAGRSLLDREGEGRQEELQYYIQLLLDRSPGEPVDPPAEKEREQPTAHTGLSARPQPARQSVLGRPPPSSSSAAVLKTKVRPLLTPAALTKDRAEPAPARGRALTGAVCLTTGTQSSSGGQPRGRRCATPRPPDLQGATGARAEGAGEPEPPSTEPPRPPEGQCGDRGGTMSVCAF